MSQGERPDLLGMLEHTARLSRLRMQRAFDAEGLEVTVEQWLLLELVAGHPGSHQRKLSALSGKDPATITRMLDLLSRRQLVLRQPVPGNRRSFEVALTRQGQALLKARAPWVAQLRSEGISGLGVDDAAALNRILNAWMAHLEDAL